MPNLERQLIIKSLDFDDFQTTELPKRIQLNVANYYIVAIRYTTCMDIISLYPI